jgi:hypothetical protein
MAQAKAPVTNGSAPAGTTINSSASTETIPFADAVVEGKAIWAKIKEAEDSKLRLGELAHKVVHPTYGDRTFAKFAEQIGIDKNTLGHHRTTYRAWENILPPGAKFPSFAVLKELATVEDRAELIKAEPAMTKRRAAVYRVLKAHPHREEILSEEPDLTCTRKARELMEKYDAGGAKKKANEDKTDFNESKRLLGIHFKLANDMIGAAEARKKCPPEQRRNLGKAAAALPASLKTMRQAGEAWLEYVDCLEKLAAEAKEAAEAEGRIKRSPTSAASESAQAQT